MLNMPGYSYVSGLERRISSLEQALLATNPALDIEELVPLDDAILRQQLSSVIPSVRSLSMGADSPVSHDIPSRSSSPDSLPAGLNGFDWGETEQGGSEEVPNGQKEREGSIGYTGVPRVLAAYLRLPRYSFVFQGD